LADVKLHSGDFRWAINQARHGDLVYADPPYTINHENNGFLKYNQRLFAWEDQLRLHSALLKAMRKGAFVIVSNACHESIYDLYANDFTVATVARFSRISGKSIGRRSGSEYLITGVSK
jgi:DNA adenine methylase